MPNFIQYIKKDFKIHKNIKKHNDQYLKDIDYFQPTGIQVFFGDEGSGKTIVLMYLYNKLYKRYPYAKTVSNIKLNNLKAVNLSDHATKVQNIDKNYYEFRSKEDLLYSIKSIRNGTRGVIQLNDEYQNYFSNQDSKNVPPALIEQNAQNRKQRRLMLCTSQDYDQLAKPIRRRCNNAIRCKTYSIPFIGPCFSIYRVYNAKRIDFDNNGRQTGDKALKTGFFFHSVDLRESYDTNQIIFTGDQSDSVYRDSQQSTANQPSISSLKVKRRFLGKRR